MTTTGTIRARRTSYNGIMMRSRLEASFAQWLDSLQLDWEYEPLCYANETGQYLPDFKIKDVRIVGLSFAIRDLFVEVKPESFLTTWAAVEALGRRMAVIPESEGECVLAMPGQMWILSPGIRPDPWPVRFFGSPTKPYLVAEDAHQIWKWQG